ncbi:MAG: acyl-CoA thioesterase [Acidobacteriaceae bacterium]|nr:acyl-CoA thioesterase [Acidobacteriaceae bacterium]
MTEDGKLLTPAQTSVIRRLRFSTDLRLRRHFLLTDEDVRSNLRFGLLLEVLDKLAEDTALRYVHRSYPTARVVTAAMDSMKVRGVPDEKRDMILRARVNLVGRTSLEVGIRIEQPPLAPGEPVLHVASCYFTMVARMREPDGSERSVPLPGLEYRSKLDNVRADRARKRRESYRLYQCAAEAPPSAEEYALLRRLHEAQAQSDPAVHWQSDPVVYAQDGGEISAQSEPKILLASPLMAGGWERTYVEHENVPHKIFGGYVAHRAYMYAHICSEMVASHRALLVSVDRINFHQPVRMGDKLHFVSRVAFTGKTSITVETSITRISRDRKSTALSNVCSFTFVNVDAELHPKPVPQIYPTTYAEDARYLAGYRRHQAHLAQIRAAKGE